MSYMVLTYTIAEASYVLHILMLNSQLFNMGIQTEVSSSTSVCSLVCPHNC